MELILLRHGTTQGNLERRFIGVTDLPLIPEGEALARKVSPTLPKIERLYVSPLLRCRQTAALLWPGMEQTVIPQLRETDFGPFEGKSHQELRDDPMYQRWLAGEMAVGEPAEDCARRGSRALEALAEDALARGFTRIGVVSHGGLLMGMLTRCGRPARTGFYDWYPQNCGGYRAELVWEPLELHILGPAGRTKA